MYDAEIKRAQPACFLFLIDQSASMDEEFPEGGSKSQVVADVLNRTLAELVAQCTRSEGVRDYFDVGILGYGAHPGMDSIISLGDEYNHGVVNCLNTNQVLAPISQVAQTTIRVEKRKKKEPDGAGGMIEVETNFPVWVEPEANGGTPMKTALIAAAQELAVWCDNHPSSHPPIVLHISDGEANDIETGNELIELTEVFKGLQTENGKVLLFNLHISETRDDPIRFPAELHSKNPLSQLLFTMSSELPARMLAIAGEYLKKEFEEGTRGFVFNGKAEDIVYFVQIGTRNLQQIPDR